MGGIFLIQAGGDLVEMTEQPYDTEDVFQELLARYPNLLAGDQIGGAAPRRWLLVAREVGVPGEEGGSDRWSLDHLFLDQDAVPTLVEVKRGTDFNQTQSVSFVPVLKVADGSRYPISVNTSGNLWVQMRWLRESEPFRDEGKREELRQRLNAIPGVSVPPERMTGYPTILLRSLADDASLRACLDTLTWVIGGLRTPRPG